MHTFLLSNRQIFFVLLLWMLLWTIYIDAKTKLDVSNSTKLSGLFSLLICSYYFIKKWTNLIRIVCCVLSKHLTDIFYGLLWSFHSGLQSNKISFCFFGRFVN